AHRCPGLKPAASKATFERVSPAIGRSGGWIGNARAIGGVCGPRRYAPAPSAPGTGPMSDDDFDDDDVEEELEELEDIDEEIDDDDLDLDDDLDDDGLDEELGDDVDEDLPPSGTTTVTDEDDDEEGLDLDEELHP